MGLGLGSGFRSAGKGGVTNGSAGCSRIGRGKCECGSVAKLDEGNAGDNGNSGVWPAFMCLCCN